MNCWFCHQPVATILCNSKECRPHYVTYIMQNLNIENPYLFKIQFKVLLQNHDYFINYFPSKKQMEVIERITLPLDPESVSMNYSFKTIFTVTYSSITITPQNAQSKLPLLILFS